jgi:hypothetical protein
VGLTALIASALVAVLGLVSLRVTRDRSLRLAALIAPITAVVAMAVGVVATAHQMFLSPHDLKVVLVVCAVAGLAGQ